jgi:hypothetical protein
MPGHAAGLPPQPPQRSGLPAAFSGSAVPPLDLSWRPPLHQAAMADQLGSAAALDGPGGRLPRQDSLHRRANGSGTGLRPGPAAGARAGGGSAKGPESASPHGSGRYGGAVASLLAEEEPGSQRSPKRLRVPMHAGLPVHPLQRVAAGVPPGRTQSGTLHDLARAAAVLEAQGEAGQRGGVKRGRGGGAAPAEPDAAGGLLGAAALVEEGAKGVGAWEPGVGHSRDTPLGALSDQGKGPTASPGRAATALAEGSSAQQGPGDSGARTPPAVSSPAAVATSCVTYIITAS